MLRLNYQLSYLIHLLPTRFHQSFKLNTPSTRILRLSLWVSQLISPDSKNEASLHLLLSPTLNLCQSSTLPQRPSKIHCPRDTSTIHHSPLLSSVQSIPNSKLIISGFVALKKDFSLHTQIVPTLLRNTKLIVGEVVRERTS
jgi:hypothetical protein